MPARVSIPPALRTVLDTAIVISRRSSTAQVAIARFAAVAPGARLPSVVQEEIDAAVEATAEAMQRRTVERALRSAWESAPAKVLDDIEWEPLAVRPAAQVHRAVHDGRPVAVKVLRPGLAAAVRADLVLIDAVGVALGAAFARLDVGGVLDEVREAAMDELDLEHEGTQARTVGRALRRVDGIVLPAVVSDLTADEVLVTDYVDGPTLLEIVTADRVGAHFAAADLDPDATARAILGAHLNAVAATGLVATDPRPGHVILGADGRIGLLGMGVARRWPVERLHAILDALAALRDPDGAAAFAQIAGERLEAIDSASARAAHELLREILGDLITGPARLDQEAVDAVVDRALARLPEAFALAARATPRPADVSALRGAGQLVATLATLGATEDWVALARELLHSG